MAFEPGESALATQAPGVYKDRPRRPTVYGLVVHTTGGGAPNAAAKKHADLLEWCISRYCRTYGCHYVCGYAGLRGGLVQVGDEFERPCTVGMGDQVKSIKAGRWIKDLSKPLREAWMRQWAPKYETSLELLPRGTSANQFYVGCEMPPCVWWDEANKRTATSATPMRDGLRFTRDQHDAIVALAMDLADRHNWPEQSWWNTPRLLGHEDLSPITRSNKSGGWDPGWLRPDPYFDFDYVRAQIARKVLVP